MGVITRQDVWVGLGLGTVIVAASLAGRAKESDLPLPNAPINIPNYGPQIDELKSTIKAQDDYIGQLAERISSQENRYAHAYFETDQVGGGYGRVETSLGPMLVTIEDIEEFAGGSRATLKIGNLTAATIATCNLVLKWRRKAPVLAENATEEQKAKHRNDLMAWFRSEQNKESAITRRIPAGTWVKARVTLPDVPPSQLNYLTVALRPDQIVMSVQP